jgi:glycoside/pentoside/hexuronide:cation symporter, GPH family
MKEQETVSVQLTKPEDKIRFMQLAAYGAGGIIPIALFNVAGILVGLMGNISLGLSAFWLGVILIIPRLWDALSDPVIGHISDNTRTRWGRRRPYLLLGGILVAVCFVVMWWIPKGDTVHSWFPTDSGFQWFQLSYILVTLLLFFTAVNIFEIPHGALGMEMTTDYHERTRLFSAKSFIGNLFAMSTPWLFALANMQVFKGTGGNEADGMRYVSIMIAAILIPLSFWWFSKLKEPGFVRAAKQEKTPFWQDMKRTATNKNFIILTLTVFTLAMGFNFVSLLGSYIPIFYVFGGDKVSGAWLLGVNGTIWAVTGLLAVFPLNWISPRIGKRKTLVISISLMCLAQLSKIVCYNQNYPYLLIIPTILLSSGMLFFFTLGPSMVGDICDEEELITGKRTEGSYYSIFWWFIKMGTAFASFVAGALIVFTSFDQIQVTKVDKVQGTIRELSSKVQYWKESQKLSETELLGRLKEQNSEALDESKAYLTTLKKESLKKTENGEQNLTISQSGKKALIISAISSARSTVDKLEINKLQLDNANPKVNPSEIKSREEVTIPLTLETKLLKSSINSSELKLHLEEKSSGSKNSAEHYKTLVQNMTGLNKHIAGLNTAMPLDLLEKELEAILKETISLTKQTPYTLLMMRVVEIGLPVLLSLLSLFFVTRYTLTEKRSHEIKEILKQRNADRLKKEEGESEFATV